MLENEKGMDFILSFIQTMKTLFVSYRLACIIAVEILIHS